MIISSKYEGCFLGLAVGDATGAPFEGAYMERLLWKLIGKTSDGKIRYTDDTQMSIDLANSLLANNGVNQDHLANIFAENYKWSRGYGPSTAWMLKKCRNGAKWQDVNCAKFKEGSFGNGAAMRAPILGMFYSGNQNELNENVKKASEITHAHPLAIEGAQIIALVTTSALFDWDTKDILNSLPKWCNSKEYNSRIKYCIRSVQEQMDISHTDIRKHLGNSIVAFESTITAIYFALQYREKDLEYMLNKIQKLSGDTDTIGAMAGAIWGAFNGSAAINESKVQSIENADKIIELSSKLHVMSSNKQINQTPKG